jgi:hypothetical protein
MTTTCAGESCGVLTGDYEHADNGKDVDWDGHELGVGRCVAQVFDDRGDCCGEACMTVSPEPLQRTCGVLTISADGAVERSKIASARLTTERS